MGLDRSNYPGPSLFFKERFNNMLKKKKYFWRGKKKIIDRAEKPIRKSPVFFEPWKVIKLK